MCYVNSIKGFIMSTYTNFSIPIKENLMRLRNPGCMNDGTCPDRVLFTNPENEYCGKLMGSMHISNCRIDSCDITNSTFHYEGISGNDMTFSISDMTSISSHTNDVMLSTNEIIKSFAKLTDISCIQTISISSSLQDVASAIICIKDVLSSIYNSINGSQPSASFDIIADENSIQKKCTQNKNMQCKNIQHTHGIQDELNAKSSYVDATIRTDENDERHKSFHCIAAHKNVLNEINELRKENYNLLQENDGYLIKISELVFENAQLKSQLNVKR